MMTFLEASFSGYKFKRADRKKYLTFDENGNLSREDGEFAVFNIDWLRAGDWEVLEPQVIVTKSEFMDTYAKACDKVHGGVNFVSVLEVVSEMAKTLNL
jgi:hypothetical protein